MPENTAPTAEPLMSVAEVALLLRTSTGRVLMWARASPLLKPRRVGVNLYFLPEDVDRFIAHQRGEWLAPAK